MSEKTIMVPVGNKLVKASPFYAEDVASALEKCIKKGRPLFMPAIIDARIAAPVDAYVWQDWFTALSLRATGHTKQGSAVVVYAHVPHYFSKPANIRAAVKDGLLNRAGRLPEKEFYRLVKLAENGEGASIVPHEKLVASVSGVVPVDDALAHPQTVPFIGSEERAVKYLARHREVYGDKIGIRHCDDLGEEPRGRLLFLGGCDDTLGGSSSLDYDLGRFVGVRRQRRAEGAAQKNEKRIAEPTLDEMVELHASIGREFVPEILQERYARKVRAELKRHYR